MDTGLVTIERYLFLSATFMAYLLPTAVDVPRIELPPARILELAGVVRAA